MENAFSRTIFSGFLLLGCGATAAVLPEPAKLPNIIFILTDDQRWDALGYAGNKVIRTPEMDRLAREGVYFRNAFVTTPICAASRASILTGLYERSHGYTFEKGNIRQEFLDASYPVLLRNSVYYTGFFGKLGVETDQASHLFDVVDVYDRNNRFRDHRGYFYKTIGGDTVHLTRFTGQQALDFISTAPENRPFCLSLSFSAPHAHDPAPQQYFWSPEEDTLYQNHVFDPPFMAEAECFEELPEYVRTGLNRTRWYWRFDTPEKYQKSMKGYYRMISGIDAEIGKIRRLLETKKIADNTIIIFMGDNGYFLGERQLAGKWLMYEPSLRVPLVIFDPRNAHHRDIDDIVLNIDIPSTILDFAGSEEHPHWQGISLASYVKGKAPASCRRDFLCEHLWENRSIPPSEGIRSTGWKYFRYRHDPSHEELYDLRRDNLEKFNLASHGEYKRRLVKMRKETDRKVKKLTAGRP